MTPAQEGNSLGKHLRALRSSAGGSLADMAAATRIGQGYLRALESDARDGDLPAPVFVRGFIRAYCAYLGAPADEALACYNRELGLPAVAVSRPVGARPRKGWIGHPLLISSALLLVLGGGLLALKLGSEPPPAPSMEQRAAVPAPESAPEIAPVPAPGTSMPVSAARPAPAGVPETQRLVVRAVEPTWIRVQFDDGRVLEELLQAGAQREWKSDRRFVLTIGNAGGIEVVLNGRPLPSLGARGMVIRQLSLPGLSGQGS